MSFLLRYEGTYTDKYRQTWEIQEGRLVRAYYRLSALKRWLLAGRKWLHPGFSRHWLGIKLVMNHDRRHQGYEVPKGYGMAWRMYERDASVFMLVPLNWLARRLRHYYLTIRFPEPDQWEDRCLEAMRKHDEERLLNYGPMQISVRVDAEDLASTAFGRIAEQPISMDAMRQCGAAISHVGRVPLQEEDTDDTE